MYHHNHRYTMVQYNGLLLALIVIIKMTGKLYHPLPGTKYVIIIECVTIMCYCHSIITYVWRLLFFVSELHVASHLQQLTPLPSIYRQPSKASLALCICQASSNFIMCMIWLKNDLNVLCYYSNRFAMYRPLRLHTFHTYYNLNKHIHIPHHNNYSPAS